MQRAVEGPQRSVRAEEVGSLIVAALSRFEAAMVNPALMTLSCIVGLRLRG